MAWQRVCMLTGLNLADDVVTPRPLKLSRKVNGKEERKYFPSMASAQKFLNIKGQGSWYVQARACSRRHLPDHRGGILASHVRTPTQKGLVVKEDGNVRLPHSCLSSRGVCDSPVTMSMTM